VYCVAAPFAVTSTWNNRARASSLLLLYCKRMQLFAFVGPSGKGFPA
jgi:hypothetical protein